MYYLTEKQKNIISSYCLGYYTPKKWNRGIDHHASILFSDYILHQFKNDLIDREDRYIQLAAEECFETLYAMNIDIVVRPLSHNERIASKAKSKSINVLGEQIAKKLDAKYMPECIISNRNNDSRIPLKNAGNFNNRKEIIKNDNLAFNFNKDFKTKGLSPSILIIDDITTSGATAQGVAKAIKSYNDSCDIYLFVLGETCSYSHVSEERMVKSKQRNEKLINLVNNFNKQQNKAKTPTPKTVEKDWSYDVDEMNILVEEAKKNRAKRQRKNNQQKHIEKKKAEKRYKYNDLGRIMSSEEKQKIKLIENARKKRDERIEKAYKENQSIRLIKRKKEKDVKEKDLKGLKEIKNRKNDERIKNLIEKKKPKKDSYVRLTDLAKELKVSHKKIIIFLNNKGIYNESDAPPSSSVNQKTEKLIRKEFVNEKKKTLRKKGITGDIFGFLGLITFIYFVFFYEPENQLDQKFEYKSSYRGDYSSFNNKKNKSTINGLKDKYENTKKDIENELKDRYENTKKDIENELKDRYKYARKFVIDNYEDSKKDIEKSLEKNKKEALKFLNKNEKKTSRNNSQKNRRDVKKITSCNPNEQFHTYDTPARLSNTKSNFVSKNVKIYKSGPGEDDTKWNIYLEATQFHNGKFKRHKKKEKVVVRCFIDQRGKILNTSIIQNTTYNSFFEFRAKEFVKKLKFIPANKDYKNVCMWISVPVYFSKRR